MDLEGPSAVHPHCVYFLMAAKWIPLAERLKYWLVAGCGENEIDEYVSPSDIALGEMRIDAWKRTLDFLGKLRSNKPLSVRSRDAEGAESFGIRPKPGESVFELKCPSEPGDDEIEISEKPIEAELEFHSFDIFPPTIKIR
jgi:hypothetical protein